MTNRIAHPSHDDLRQFALGKLDPQAWQSLEDHVADCEVCCEVLKHVENDTLVGLLKVAETLPPDAGDAPTAKDPPSKPAERPAAPGAPPRVPKELADHPRYRVVGLLGAGGMGVVYKAEHRIMQRTVALKVIRREMMDNPKAVERFHLEVRTAARLAHPNIVTAHDAEQAGDLHFLVMEYVEGASLARLVEKRGALPVQHACHYARQAALGLQHAHEQGTVHRDIKPQNLILTKKGQVKILDFGLARFAREHGPLEGFGGGGTSRSITAPGSVFGTPDYIAPEQARDAHQADIRADIYSLGCTLYYLLAGHVPFPQGSATEKMLAHLDRHAAPQALSREDVPAELIAVINRMMAKDPQDRYATPAEAAKALAPFAKGETLPPVDPLASFQPAGLDLLEQATAFQQDSLLRREAGLQGVPSVGMGFPSQLWPLPQSQSLVSPAMRFQRLLRRWRVPALAILFGVLFLSGAWYGVSKLISLLPDGFPVLAQGQPGKASSGSAVQPAAAGGTCGFASDCSGSAATAGAAPTSVSPQLVVNAPGKRVLIVVPNAFYWEPDYTPLRNRLEQGGVQVTVASSARTPATPMGNPAGQPMLPDMLVSEADADSFDAVVFTGGSVDEFLNGTSADPARQIVRQMSESGKCVAGICVGQKALFSAGVMKGGQAARSSFVEDERYDHFEVTPLQQSVVIWGRAITAGAPKDAVPLAEAILQALSNPP